MYDTTSSKSFETLAGFLWSQNMILCAFTQFSDLVYPLLKLFDVIIKNNYYNSLCKVEKSQNLLGLLISMYNYGRKTSKNYEKLLLLITIIEGIHLLHRV
jgi:hypothetical protein